MSLCSYVEVNPRNDDGGKMCESSRDDWKFGAYYLMDFMRPEFHVWSMDTE